MNADHRDDDNVQRVGEGAGACAALVRRLVPVVNGEDASTAITALCELAEVIAAAGGAHAGAALATALVVRVGGPVARALVADADLRFEAVRREEQNERRSAS